MNRSPSIAALTFTLVLLAGCDQPPSAPPGPGPGKDPARLELASDSLSLKRDESRPLGVAVTARDGSVLPPSGIRWTSSQEGVATVDSTGRLVALRSGRTVVHARLGVLHDSVRVRVEISWRSVAAGALHACALDSDGAAYCWGDNREGQLGDGSTTARSLPTPVRTEARFTQLALGRANTCGLASGGEVYCWGNNRVGAVGDGTTTSRNVPTRVPGLPPSRSLAVGLGVLSIAENGGLYCWGLVCPGGREVLSPLLSTRVASPATVAMGDSYACVTAAGGAAFCWGTQLYGVLGTVAQGGELYQVSGDLRFTSLSGGLYHACGITVSGQTYCWGDNRFGQLGSGAATPDTRPPHVSPGLAPTAVVGAPRFGAVSAGGLVSCGLDVEGEAYCWGNNSYGQLGIGSTLAQAVPAKVAGGHRFAVIAVGDFLDDPGYPQHACGVTRGGEAYCWGDNGFGQLGTGAARGSFSAPVRVREPST